MFPDHVPCAPARVYNERAGQPMATVDGCVTTGEDWQFLSLSGTIVTLHRPRLYIDDVGSVLAAFGRAVGGGAEAAEVGAAAAG